MDGHSPPAVQIQSWVHFTGRTPKLLNSQWPRDTGEARQMFLSGFPTDENLWLQAHGPLTRWNQIFVFFSLPFFLYLSPFFLSFHTVQPPSGLTAHRYRGQAVVAGCSWLWHKRTRRKLDWWCSKPHLDANQSETWAGMSGLPRALPSVAFNPLPWTPSGSWKPFLPSPCCTQSLFNKELCSPTLLEGEMFISMALLS